MKESYEQWLGRDVGGYRVERLLREGAVGAVFLAYQPHLNRRAALKLLPAEMATDSEQMERFVREARVLSRLQHACIIQVYDLFRDSSRCWMAVEYMPRGSAGTLLHTVGPLPLWMAGSITREAALGLAAAAGAGVIHRDIKPDNILLTVQLAAKVADFGLARAVDEGRDITQSGIAMGTAAYMSPEQWRDSRRVDQRADLYSLGCALWEMLVGAPPFPGPAPYNFMLQHCSEPAPDLQAARADVPPALVEIMRRLLAKNPEDRFPDGGELARALESAVPPRPRDAVLPPMPPPVPTENGGRPSGAMDRNAGHDVRQKTPRLLVAEDDPNQSRVMERVLRGEGYDVVLASDGEQALRLVREERPSLVLMDIDLPGQTGLEVLRTLRDDGNTVPVIMVTGHDLEQDKVLGLQLGADDYVTKPYGVPELLARIKARLRPR